MAYHGMVIAESLANQNVLEHIAIVGTQVVQIGTSEATPWLKQWTIHQVIISEAEIIPTIEALRRSLDPSRRSWYIALSNDHDQIVIYPKRIFQFQQSDAIAKCEAIEYGQQWGIPGHQLDF